MVRKNLWRTLIFCARSFASRFSCLTATRRVPMLPLKTHPDRSHIRKSSSAFFREQLLCVSQRRAEQTADLSLEAFKTAASLSKDRGTMKLILDKLNAGAMPPAGNATPKAERRIGGYSVALSSTGHEPEKGCTC